MRRSADPALVLRPVRCRCALGTLTGLAALIGLAGRARLARLAGRLLLLVLPGGNRAVLAADAQLAALQVDVHVLGWNARQVGLHHVGLVGLVHVHRP